MKKSLFPFLLTFTLSLVVFSGSSGSCTLAAQTVNPLPQHPDTLRILAIGNSFSIDGMVYLPKLLENAGIHNVILGNLYIGGCSLERHCNEYETSSKSYVYYKSGPDHTWKSWKNASLKYGIKNEDWDIITVQESSGISGIYDNIHTWLPRLMEIVRKECTNPDVAIVWHETWAYSRNSDHGSFPNYDRNQETMYKKILECVGKLQEDFGIKTVIRDGEAIQMARKTALNNVEDVSPDSKVYDLTRDGFHLSNQYGRYIAACVWFETLIRPTLGKSVKDVEYRLDDTESRISKKEARLCRKIAVKACK